MPRTVRLSDEAYEQLRQEATARGTSIAEVATTRLSDRKDAPANETSDAIATGMLSKGEQPLQVTLIDKRQDERIDQHEQYIKQLTAASISNRAGILELAGDRAEEIDSMMTGAYNKLMGLGMRDIAKEIKALSEAIDNDEFDGSGEDE